MLFAVAKVCSGVQQYSVVVVCLFLVIQCSWGLSLIVPSSMKCFTQQLCASPSIFQHLPTILLLFDSCHLFYSACILSFAICLILLIPQICHLLISPIILMLPFPFLYCLHYMRIGLNDLKPLIVLCLYDLQPSHGQGKSLAVLFKPSLVQKYRT